MHIVEGVIHLGHGSFPLATRDQRPRHFLTVFQTSVAPVAQGRGLNSSELHHQDIDIAADGAFERAQVMGWFLRRLDPCKPCRRAALRTERTMQLGGQTSGNELRRKTAVPRSLNEAEKGDASSAGRLVAWLQNARAGSLSRLRSRSTGPADPARGRGNADRLNEADKLLIIERQAIPTRDRFLRPFALAIRLAHPCHMPRFAAVGLTLS